MLWGVVTPPRKEGNQVFIIVMDFDTKRGIQQLGNSCFRRVTWATKKFY